jgi:hypothetical protein
MKFFVVVVTPDEPDSPGRGNNSPNNTNSSHHNNTELNSSDLNDSVLRWAEVSLARHKDTGTNLGVSGLDSGAVILLLDVNKIKF